MADVCIVYARADASDIPPALEAELSETWSVWWDAKIVAGDYRKAIEYELATAGCVIPVWSVSARESKTLCDEVQIAIDLGVPIVPIRIHDVKAPLGYGSFQATEIIGWVGEPGREEIGKLKTRIEKVLKERRAANCRPADFGYGEPSRLPVLFFSVSSHETQLAPPAAVKALDVFDARTILVSAYDMAGGRRSKEMVRTLERRRKRGSIVLLDSGTYEKTRRNDKSWTTKLFREALEETPHDLAFCFDKLNPSGDLDGIVRGIVNAVTRDTRHTDVPVLPIVHLPQKQDNDYRVDLAPALVRRVSEELRPPLIAIPERELGSGIFCRATTMYQIRQALRELSYYQHIHVLGTGNPTSIALLAAAGADSFDGLEWCRFVADAQSATLHHFQHFELFRYQAELAGSPITRSAAVDRKVHYTGQATFHNLDFYTEWMKKLRAAAGDDKRLVEFMTDLLPKGAMDQAREALPAVL